MAFIPTFIIPIQAVMHASWNKYFIVFVLLLHVITAMAQPDFMQNQFKHKKDSLIEELKNHPNPDTARAKALFKIIEDAAFLKEKKEVLPYWVESIALSRKLKFK